MLELISVANRLYRWELSVSESMATLAAQSGFAQLRAPLADYFERTAQTVAAFSATISARKQLHADRDALRAALGAHAGCCDVLEQLAGSGESDAQPAAHELEQLADEARRTHDLLERAAATLEDSIELEPQEELAAEPQHRARTIWATLSGAIGRGSSVTRYAARLGMAVAFGVIVYSVVGLEHGFWITFTIVAVMKPDFGGSRRVTVQRVTATVIGGIVVAGHVGAALADRADRLHDDLGELSGGHHLLHHVHRVAGRPYNARRY
jgi:uncharacterized membrane protein YccC